MNPSRLHVVRPMHHLLYLVVAGALAVAAFLATPSSPALAASSITVDSTADGNTADSVLTLREAILLANGGVGGDGVTNGLGRGLELEESDNLGGGVPGAGSVDTINFSDPPFAVGNPGAITVSTVLPTLLGGNDVIDGTGRGVRIDGAGSPSAFSCLTIDSALNTVKGLQLTDCANGVYIVVDGAANTIGPGNTFNHNTKGIVVGGHQNTIKGNKIGTGVDGTSADATTYNSTGVSISGINNVIGGATPADRNIISGNGTGIELEVTAAGNAVKGNYIGTDVTGALDRGNSGAGVAIRGQENVIGGTAAGEGNVISGNGSEGIWTTGAATDNLIQGNYIGTNAAGSASIENEFGLNIQSPGNTVGGAIATARNVISGNNNMGVRVTGSGNVVQGNLVGTAVDGTTPLGNGNQGIRIENGLNNIVDRNVIADSGDAGIRISGTSPGTVLKGNHIGTDYGGLVDLGNAQDGVYVGSSSIAVGGISDSEGNVIAFNGGDGVHVASGTANRISFNQIENNDGLGIDLAGGTEDAFGVTANDASPDSDTGPNNLQNYPAVGLFDLDVVSNVTGTLDSAPNTTYTLQFFYGAGCDGSLYGEGPNFLFEGNVNTDGAGHVSFTLFFNTPPELFTPTQYVSATATDPSGNTSELSRCQAVVKRLSLKSAGQKSCSSLAVAVSLQCSAGSVPTNPSAVALNPSQSESLAGTLHGGRAWAGFGQSGQLSSALGTPSLSWSTPGKNNSDLVLVGPSYNKIKANNDGYVQRFDLNANDSVTNADVILIGPFYNKGCG